MYMYIHYAQTEFGLFFQMSAITVGCLDAYKKSVDTTCDSVDSSIKVKGGIRCTWIVSDSVYP